MRTITYFWLLFALLGPAVLPAQDSAAVYAKERYEFLNQELSAYREYLQQERTEHRQFLEQHYQVAIGVGSAAVVLFLAIVGFFGWRTRKDVREQAKALEQQAKRQLKAEVTKAERAVKDEAERAVAQAKSRYEADIREIFTSEIQDYEQKYQTMLKLLEQQIAVNQGKYLFISTAEKLEQMESEGAELHYASKALGAIKTKIASPKQKDIKLDEVDVVVYRSNVDENGEDEYLKEVLIPALNKYKSKLPLVVYAKGFEERLKGQTETVLNEYLLYQIANNTGTLIDNTASAFRVYRLIEKQPPHA